ncbi:MAG TPA: tyrosine-type recombinase/integrase [Vicinamibacterales bacterium]|nr:tyrosine-type recombinase/integrase [Vicinamibacterales bacterium]
MVRVVPYKKGGWMIDVRTRFHDGSRFRERRVLFTSKSAAQRWGEERERHLLVHGAPVPKKEVPTLSEFAPRFIEGHAQANRQKPSTIAAKENILKVHLLPLLGTHRLDRVTNEDVQMVKAKLQDRSPKTVNNVLGVLSVVLRKAVEWNVLERVPCTIRLLPTPKPKIRFYDFGEYDRLLDAAKAARDPQALVVALLAGDAGLRRGEIAALEWADVDLERRQICVQRSDWNGHVTAPKGGRLRHVPMTLRLASAVRKHRHLRSNLVLCTSDGESLTPKMVTDYVRRAARRAHLVNAGIHILRHTFCSHLAMRGAPARAIQELAGHQDIGTTQRYMHLSPAALDAAIRLLEMPDGRGNIGAMPS